MINVSKELHEATKSLRDTLAKLTKQADQKKHKVRSFGITFKR